MSMHPSDHRPRERLTDSRLANLGANTIAAAFSQYQDEFRAITARAQTRFARRDWPGMLSDAAERLDLYRKAVDPTVAAIRGLLGERVTRRLVWVSLKAVYSGLIAERDDWELAETFFNSITRRLFTTVGVDNQIEFVDTDFETPPTPSLHAVYRAYPRAPSNVALVETILSDALLQAPFQSLSRDAELVAHRIGQHLRELGALQVVERAEMLKSVFYRGKGAYLIGRMYSGAHVFPIALALLNTSQGIIVDAVLLNEDEVSILFSFTRSYFQVNVDRPYDLTHFLKSIMPRKRLAELYISIGRNKHGKTELYRDLLHHLVSSDDQFEIAPGARGMVMTVFTMPSYDVVFKVIKDRFDEPKKKTREEVRAKYRLVFGHDRAGRLIDAQEFEHLQFERRRFGEPLVAELQRTAAQTVTVDDHFVVFKHLYVERRLTPLNIYVREAGEHAVRAAIVDYGHCIKDLAAANIFPGDILLKNFGVTRHGRIVFYDYDELTLLTDCHFREMPQAQNDDDDMAGEPWFFVGENDFFPEEFRVFLGLEEPWRSTFLQDHGDLFCVDFWRCIQDRIRSGEIIHIFPYPQDRRFPTFEGGTACDKAPLDG